MSGIVGPLIIGRHRTVPLFDCPVKLRVDPAFGRARGAIGIVVLKIVDDVVVFDQTGIIGRVARPAAAGAVAV